MAERMQRVVTGEIVDYPIRVDHIDGAWTLAPNDDARRRGASVRCDDPICSICHVCSFCLKQPPVGITEDLYTICAECAELESPVSGPVDPTKEDKSND